MTFHFEAAEWTVWLGVYLLVAVVLFCVGYFKAKHYLDIGLLILIPEMVWTIVFGIFLAGRLVFG